LAAEISKELGISAELIVGDKGIFDVTADAEIVFSKYAAGRFPDNQEIIDALKERLSSG
jgi:predicted Rdx family selenoprotein